MDLVENVLQGIGLWEKRKPAPSQNSSRNVLGVAKYRSSKFVSMETLWLMVFSLSAESMANVALPFALDGSWLLALLRRSLPAQVNAWVLLLNLSGAVIDGMILYLAKWHLQFDSPPLLLVGSASLGVYTSLAGVVENAASLSDGKYSGAFLAPCFVAIMLVAGCLANCIGRMLVEYAMAPILERCGVINHKHAELRTVQLVTTVWDDVLFYACLSFLGGCVMLCANGDVSVTVEELLFGWLFAALAQPAGVWVALNAEYQGVQWGTLRCNCAALIMLFLSASAASRSPSLLALPIFNKFVGTFIGAVSAFTGTCNDTVELVRLGRIFAASGNLAVNLVAMLTCMILLRSGPTLLAAAQDSIDSIISIDSVFALISPPPPPAAKWAGYYLDFEF